MKELLITQEMFRGFQSRALTENNFQGMTFDTFLENLTIEGLSFGISECPWGHQYL